MKLARLYIPKYPNKPVEALKQRLIDCFNGYTMHAFGVGAWKNPAGQLIQEPVYIFDVVVQDDDDAAVRWVVEQYKEEAEQSTSLYILDNKPNFI